MNKNTLRLLPLSVAVICTAFLASLPANAQENKPINVLQLQGDHAVSPALRDLPPDPPSGRHQVFDVELFPRHNPDQLEHPDQARQTVNGPLVNTSNFLNFDGISENCGEPSDSNGAIGATQYVEWINCQFAVYNKTTGALVSGPFNGNTLFTSLGGQCASNNSGDPIAQYDKLANRWVLTQPVFSAPYYQCIAVSQTSDATGAYNVYAFALGSTNFPDYPKLGVWPDAYYVTHNLFVGNSYVGPQVCAFDRSKMLTGAAATAQCFTSSNSGLTSSDFSLLPSDVDGTTPPPSGEPNLILELDRTIANSNLDLWKFHVDFSVPANSTLTGPTAIPVTAWSYACGGTGGTCVPQLGTGQTLDTLGDRMMYRLAYRNFGAFENLMVTHTVASGGVTGVRWYEIRNPNGSPTVFQQGTFQPDSTYRWMPSIAMDSNQDIAVGYSLSSSSIHPEIGYTGRVPGDPAGTLETEDVTFSGTGSESGHSRWGDYSAMTVDPVDDCTMWYIAQYIPVTGDFNWHTRINNFKFTGCAGTPDFTVSATPASQTVVQGAGTTYTATVSPLNGFNGNVALTSSGYPAGASGTFSPMTVTGGSGTSTLSVTTMNTTPPGTYTITITGTSGALVHTTTVQLVVTSPTADFTLTASPSSQTVVQNGSTTYTATVTPTGGFSGTVTFSVTGLPNGATGTFNPPTVTTSGSSTLTVKAGGASTPPGTYTLTIKGTSGALNHSTTVTFVVETGTYTFAVSPTSQTVGQGASTTYTATVTGMHGFNSAVTFSVSGLPSGATGTFNPTSVTGSGSSTLTVTTANTTPTGTYTLMVTATNPGLTITTNVTLVVAAAQVGDFTLTATPSSQTVVQTGSTTYTATVAPTGGFTGTVTFSVSGLPSGATGTFNPTTVTTSGSSTLTVKSGGGSTPPGTYTLTIKGTSGALNHSTTVTFVVVAGTFTFAVTPTSQTVTHGNSTTYTATVTGSHGFNSAVTFSVSGLPSGATGTFNPTSVTGSGSSTLTVTTANTTPTGTYTLMVTASGPGLTPMQNVTLIVN